MKRVLVLGAGYTGRAVLGLAKASGAEVVAVVRRPDAEPALRARGFEVVVAPVFGPDLASFVDAHTHVVVTFPPDGETDARVAAALPPARAITYLSASSVYGDTRGVVDDTTPVTSRPSPAAARRLAAEEVWRARGATVFRCPAIYGAERGLHVRVLSGRHRIPGDGSGHISRIHVDDLAALVLASPRAPGETFVVGDAEPAPQREVVAFVCEAHGVPMPPFVAPEDVHETLRGDRSIDGSRALAVLGVTLRHPSYRTGMAPQ